MKRVEHTIAAGDKGIRETVRHMIRLTRRDMKNPKILAQARKLRGSNDEQTILNTFQYVIDNYPYRHDPEEHEMISAPVRILEGLPRDAGQDCDDLSVILAALLKANGYQVWFKIIDWKKTGEGFTHVYTLVHVPTIDKVIPLDAVMKMKGFGYEKAPVNRSEVFKI